MADPRGFLKVTERELPAKRPVAVRIHDFDELEIGMSKEAFIGQAGRCMDCGVPFCSKGCPLGNYIPEWNDAMYRDNLPRAVELLHATNNFPEFTGKACPAPCESSCVLSINQPAVTIKNIEATIVERGFAEGLIRPFIAERNSEKTVAIVGSGPAGLAAAQQLTRAGHTVVVYEKDEAPGGLLRYGIPDFKLAKKHIDRRIRQMETEGTTFRCGTAVGTDISWEALANRFDALIVCTGAPVPRELPVEGSDLEGVAFAMDYLTAVNRHVAGGAEPELDAKDKHVIVIGGGDTGSDCIGTAHRQGAASVTNIAIGYRPPESRPNNQPWPEVPRVFEVSSSHEEGGERLFEASTVRFVGEEGRVVGIELADTDFSGSIRVPTPGTERILPADLVLIAMGFSGPETEGPAEYGVSSENRVLTRDGQYQSSVPGIFVAGDAGRGQSLIVWAIAEGRAAAAEVDEFLMGDTLLPRPVKPTDRDIKVGAF